jgi:hypothetical protein
MFIELHAKAELRDECFQHIPGSVLVARDFGSHHNRPFGFSFILLPTRRKSVLVLEIELFTKNATEAGRYPMGYNPTADQGNAFRHPLPE